MTGVPYTTGSEIDVVVMLDMTGSMSTNGMNAAVAAAKAFVETIVKNADGTYNENRVAVYQFNSSGIGTYFDLQKITSDSELTTALGKIVASQSSGGTPYNTAAAKCYNVLQTAKNDGTGNGRQQFCVFMSDGGPTNYYADDGDGTYTNVYGGNSSGDVNITTYLSGYSSSDSSSWSFTLPTEYYTNLMKDDGVTVYTVGLLLQNVPSNPSPYSSMTSSTYNSTTDSLTSIGSHYYFCSSILKQMASDTSKYIDIFSVDNADNAVAKFENIAVSILQAATDITVEDKITDEYTMIFDIPTDTNYNHSISTDQEFYIEFVKYTLDENHERTDTVESVVKLYLIDSNGSTAGGTYSAGSSATAAYAAPVFANSTVGDKGTLYYWTTDSSYASKAAVSYNDGTNTYYFIPYGIKATDSGYDSTKWFNMTSGAYASGTIDAVTNTSTDLVIATPYFVYNAATKMLYWTVDKLDTYEYALRYFLYLDDSATDIGETTEIDADAYPTNEYAYITYTNFNGNECRQVFPVPQMTWNGAQVSYVFYLVNAAGQPINKSGQVVDFANATFITDVFTYNVVWNGDNAVEELNVAYLADELLPDAYTVYDENAEYTIHVYQDANGSTIFDYFIIEGSAEGTVNAESRTTVASDDTTKVYNTKAGTKYSEYGIYSASDVGSKFTTTDADGMPVTIVTTKKAELDYSDTTVAFAVLWEPELVEDTVVVDYGLDVLINVVQNDNLQNTINGIGLGKDAYGSVKMNTGVSTTSKLGTASLTTDGNTISIENENQVRFKQNDMTFQTPVTFYYESAVEFYEGSNKQEGYMYSSVTVIPATTVYYEEDFVTLKVTGTAAWETVGSVSSTTQDQDRPGASQISSALDADNVYGYDSAYSALSTYSNGAAKKVTVSKDNAGRAEFTFYGTGFDVISMTSSTTGTILVNVYAVDDAGTQTDEKSLIVDTYYGMNADGTINRDNPTDALYQVPVMKVKDLEYGKYYVTITASYSESFDHTSHEGSYDFYLDAIRIYDPTGVASGSVTNTDVLNAYVADGEAYPYYQELREMIIDAVDLDAGETEIDGVVFIDCNDGTSAVSDYTNYGPNNEVYLAPDQAIAFELNLAAYAGMVADVQIGMKSATTTAVNVTMTSDASTTSTAKIEPNGESTTDRYFSIGGRVNKSGTTVLSFTNTSTDEEAILSITNIKITYTEKPVSTNNLLTVSRSSVNSVLMALNEVEEETPETTEPEVTEPEVTEPEEALDAQLKVSVMNNSVKVGSTVVVKITTSSDVDALTVNGKEISRYTENKFTGVRTWTTTVKASEAGSMDIAVTAYNNGAALDTVTETIEVSGKTAGVIQQIVGQLIGMLFG